MFIPSTLEAVRSQYPVEFEAAISDLRKGRSRRRSEPLVSFAWGFEVYVEVQPLDFGDIVSGEAQASQAIFEALSVAEKLRDYESRCGVKIVGKMVGRVYVQSARLSMVPAEVVKHQRGVLAREELEKKRLAALSNMERQREFGAAVSRLERGKGFQALSTTRKA